MAKTEFHDRLAALRMASGMTQTQMAKHLEISRSTYANYEVGKRTPDLRMLINAGMVTVIEKTDRGMCKIRIPNQEVGRAFEELTAYHLGVSEGKLSQLGGYAVSG